MKKFYMFLCLLGLLYLSGCGLTGVEDGQTGVKFDYGKVADNTLCTGWHWYVCGITSVEVWDTKLQELKEEAAVPSREGLISTIDVSILYYTPKEKVIEIRKTIGADYKETILVPYIRESIRNVASGYDVKALYSEEGRTEIGKKIKEFLKEKLESRGIIIQDVMLRDVRLPEAFSISIGNKLKTEQEALQKEFELQKARKDAEIEVVHAQGIAKSNEIIANSITENYLRYKFIEGLNTGKASVIYVPTEANLPILEASRNKEK